MGVSFTGSTVDPLCATLTIVSETSLRPKALITGASSGIGEAFARRYARDGYDCILVGRNAAKLDELVGELNQLHVSCEALVADLSTDEGIEATAQRAVGCDAVVLNAGITHAGSIGKTPPDELAGLMRLLALGVMRVAEVAVPSMVERKRGDVIIVSSVAAFTPMRKSSAYAAAKSFVTAYGRSAHLELKSKGVRVCVLAPGYVQTELMKRAGLHHVERNMPRFMWLTPDQVVEATLVGLTRGRDVVVPGGIYKLWKPLMGTRFSQWLWAAMLGRGKKTKKK
jgi:short-subunit dehydrogenase